MPGPPPSGLRKDDHAHDNEILDRPGVNTHEHPELSGKHKIHPVPTDEPGYGEVPLCMGLKIPPLVDDDVPVCHPVLPGPYDDGFIPARLSLNLEKNHSPNLLTSNTLHSSYTSLNAVLDDTGGGEGTVPKYELLVMHPDITFPAEHNCPL